MVERMRERLAVLAPEALELADDSAAHAGHAGAREGGHYRLKLVSPLFAGKPRVARHRMVYDALAPLMKQGIHALALVTLTPAEAHAAAKTVSIKKETR
jgi:BolA protein